MAAKDLESLVTLEGKQVLTGSFDLPEHGASNFTLEVDMPAPPTTGSQVTITVASQEPSSGGPQSDPKEPTTFSCTVLWGSPWQGRSKVWLTGGMGGLRKQVARRNYVEGPVPLLLSDLLADIMAETGEELDATVTAESLAPYVVGRWHRAGSTGSAALDKICAEFGLVWRFTPAGKILVLPLDYPADAQQPYVCDPGDDGTDRCFVVAPDTATIAPATTLLGRQVNRVVYDVSADGLRATCFYGSADRDDFEAAVRTVLPEIPYLPSFAATVVSQRASGMLEVLCDDARIGPLDNVVLLAGGPRMTLRAKQGQRVRILFASGDPKLYYAVGFEQDSAATKGIARVGDSVDCGTFGGIAPPGGGPVIFSYMGPDGEASSGELIDIGGLITTGSPDQKLAPGTT